jgi:hypothetical protein
MRFYLSTSFDAESIAARTHTLPPSLASSGRCSGLIVMQI